MYVPDWSYETHFHYKKQSKLVALLSHLLHFYRLYKQPKYL